jgi:omega-6 fatty acid desaturase (delta-12 desaturase)
MKDRSPAEPHGAKAWVRILAGYRDPNAVRSGFEIAVSAAPLALLWILTPILLQHGQWWALGLTVPAAAFLVRLFMIQHDCGHGSLFKGRMLNDWVGRAIGVLTLTPYEYWRRTHAVHHATSGNLDRRELGAIELLTVKEYLGLPGWKRFLYRLYRNPVVLFGLGPAYMFLVQHRLPIGMMKAGWPAWLSALGTNLGIAVFITGGVLIFGSVPFFLTYITTVVLAAMIGVWLFYVQHQFEETSWASREDWDLHEAALRGSSHYDLPTVLRWLTANIGIHHVHHLYSRIPFYRLGETMRDHPDLKAQSRITLLQSLRCVPLALWDEVSLKLVTFRQARALAATR